MHELQPTIIKTQKWPFVRDLPVRYLQNPNVFRFHVALEGLSNEDGKVNENVTKQ